MAVCGSCGGGTFSQGRCVDCGTIHGQARPQNPRAPSRGERPVQTPRGAPPARRAPAPVRRAPQPPPAQLDPSALTPIEAPISLDPSALTPIEAPISLDPSALTPIEAPPARLDSSALRPLPDPPAALDPSALSALPEGEPVALDPSALSPLREGRAVPLDPSALRAVPGGAPAEAVRCDKCGTTQADPAAKFCEACGLKLFVKPKKKKKTADQAAGMRICTECGVKNGPDKSRCRACGCHLRGG